MRKVKASGKDEVSTNMIKATGIHGLQWLYRVMSSIWKEGKIPDDWTRDVIASPLQEGKQVVEMWQL